MRSLKDRVIFGSIKPNDLSKLNPIPVLVSKSFRTIKNEYHRGGIVKKYIITRFVISIDEIREYNDPAILFKDLSDTEYEILLKYCNGKYHYQEILQIVSQEYPSITAENLIRLFSQLTRQRTIYWIDAKDPKIISQFDHYLMENYQVSSFASEILYSYLNKQFGIPYTYVPTKVSFILTDKCNASCITCYRGKITKPFNKPRKEELSKKEIFRILKQLATIGTDRIKFLGGEPFLRNDFFEIIKEAQKYHLPCQVSTNGVLLAKESYIQAIKELQPALFGLQISIDGVDRGQKIQRKGANIQKVLTAFNNLKKNDIPFSTNTIISKINMDEIEDMIKLFATYGIRSRFQIMKACGAGREHLQYIPSPYERKVIIDRINHFSEKYNFMLDNSIRLYPFLDSEISPHEKEVTYHRCRAFTYSMAITPQGYVLPCEFVEPFDRFWDQHVNEVEIMDIWHTSKIADQFRYTEIQGKCKQCNYNYICEMGCFAETYALTGDLSASDPVCWYNDKEKWGELPTSNDYIIKTLAVREESI